MFRSSSAPELHRSAESRDESVTLVDVGVFRPSLEDVSP